MMVNQVRAIIFFCLFIAFSLSLSVVAGDLSNDVRKGASGPETVDGGYIDVGLGAAGYTSFLYGAPDGNEQGEIHYVGFLDINARYQYHGWFVELFSQSVEQPSIGYNFLNTRRWAFDLVASQEHDEISEDENKNLKGLRKRKGDLMMGPRATAYLDNYILQLHAFTDISGNHKGELYSIKIARRWQYRNWNFHSILGAAYRSEDIIDYYFSINANEASEQFPAFDAPVGMAYLTELGATYPISEKWVFRSFVRRMDIDSRVQKSPLIVDDHGEIFAISISYVF